MVIRVGNDRFTFRMAWKCFAMTEFMLNAKISRSASWHFIRRNIPYIYIFNDWLSDRLKCISLTQEMFVFFFLFQDWWTRFPIRITWATPAIKVELFMYLLISLFLCFHSEKPYEKIHFSHFHSNVVQLSWHKNLIIFFFQSGDKTEVFVLSSLWKLFNWKRRYISIHTASPIPYFINLNCDRIKNGCQKYVRIN